MAKLTKKISYVLLSLVATLCFVLAIIPAIKRPTSVQAAEATSTTIEIQDSASVRLDEYSGIRFTANVGETFYGEQGEDATWGFLVALGVDGLTTDNFVVTNESVNQVKISSWISDSWSDAVKAKKAGLKEYTLVLNNIPVNAYQMAISARAYVEVNGEYIYSPTFTTRNIHEVANAALIDNTLTFTDSEKDNLVAFVQSCSQEGDAITLHTWADRGYIASQGGYVKKCTVCGVEYISDPVYAFKDGEGVVLDRGGLEIRQLNANADIIKTFEATVKTPYKLGKTAVIFSNLPDYDKRATLEDGLEIGINSDGKFSVTIGKGNSLTFSTAAIDNGSNWYHMAMTFDTDTNEIKLYVNGTLVETKTSSLALSSVKLSDRQFYFGRNYHSGNPNAFEGNGFIKNAAIWSSVRSEADIKGDMSYIFNFHGNLMGLYDFNEEVIDNVLADHSLKNNALQVHETWFAMDAEQKALLGDYAYSLAVVGDMQSLVNYFPDKVDDLYQWVLDKQEEYKIEYLIGLGDLTENKYSYHGSVAGDWYPQIEGFNMLNGKVTHQQVRGNHDQTDYYNNVLETDEYMVNLNGYYGYGVENSYSIVYMGGYKYCFINMNNPSSTVYSQAELDWACSVIEKYSDARVIISTHSILAWNGNFQDTGDAAGTVYWENVIKKYSNVMMVYCGHIAWDPILLVRGTGDNGNTVNQMLIDAQYMDQNYGPKGMVAMFYFTEDGKSVKVRYFSSIEDKMYSIDNCFTIDTTEYADLGKNAADTDAPVVTANNQEEGLVGVRYFVKDVLVRDDKDASVTPTYTLYKKSDATKTPITLDAKRSFVPTEAGTYVLKIDVKDAAGNAKTYEFDIFVRGAELGAGVIEDFGTADTLIAYKGHATTEWLSSYQGKDGVIHFAAGTGRNSIGYKNYNFRIINTYEDLDLAGKYIKLRVYASADATLYSGYADYDGYGQSQSLIGGAWSVITVKYPSDMEYFMDRASSTAGVRLFTIKEDVDIYVDEIWVGEEAAFGAVNFDESGEQIALLNAGHNGTILTERTWLPEYDGAEGVVKAVPANDWYGIHVVFPYTAEEVKASDWEYLEIKLQMGTKWDGLYGETTGVTYTTEGNWRIYSFPRTSLVTRFGSEDAVAEKLTKTSGVDAAARLFTFWNLTTLGGVYVDYVKLVSVDPANTEFDSSAAAGYVLGQENVEWLPEYDGAKGVVKGKLKNGSYGVQVKLPTTVADLQALSWNKVEIRMTFDFTDASGRTTWDGFSSNAASFTYVTDGNWRIYSATKEGIIAKFGTLDQFYKVITDGVLGWGEHHMFALWNMREHGNMYLDYFRLVGDTSSEEDATVATTYVEDFNTATAINNVAGLTGATYLDNFMGANGVVKGAPDGAWNGIKFKLGVNQASIEALNWDLFKFRVMFDLSGSRNAWDGYYENPAKFTYVTEGPWRVYTATRENIIAGYGSIDAFFTAINSGSTRLFVLWNFSSHGNIYYDWVKFTSVANETRLVVENDFTTDSSWLKGANNVTLLDSYDGCAGVVKATPVTANGFQFKLPYTKAQLEAMDWDRFEFKVRFASGHFQSVNGSTENGINYNNGGWVFRTEGNWRIYSAKKANLVKMYGSLDAMYNVLLNADGSAAYRLFNVWNMWTLGDMYIDYVKLV